MEAETAVPPPAFGRYAVGFVLVALFALLGINEANPIRDIYLALIENRPTILAWFSYTVTWKWGLALALAYVASRREREPIAWRRPTQHQVLAASAATLAAILAERGIYALLHWQSASIAILRQALPWWMRFVVVLTAAIAEELVFRGYLLERLAKLTGSITTAAWISALAFNVIHIPTQGIAKALIGLAPGTIALTLIYVRTRSLPNVIFMHFLLDASLLF